MMEDLNLTGEQYNIAVSIFFIGYVLLGEKPYYKLAPDESATNLWNRDSLQRPSQEVHSTILLSGHPCHLVRHLHDPPRRDN